MPASGVVPHEFEVIVRFELILAQLCHMIVVAAAVAMTVEPGAIMAGMKAASAGDTAIAVSTAIAIAISAAIAVSAAMAVSSAMAGSSAIAVSTTVLCNGKPGRSRRGARDGNGPLCDSCHRCGARDSSRSADKRSATEWYVVAGDVVGVGDEALSGGFDLCLISGQSRARVAVQYTL